VRKQYEKLIREETRGGNLKDWARLSPTVLFESGASGDGLRRREKEKRLVVVASGSPIFRKRARERGGVIQTAGFRRRWRIDLVTGRGITWVEEKG